MSGPAASGSPAPRDVAFVEVMRTQMSGYDGPPAVAFGAGITARVPSASAPTGRTLVAVFQGAQRTGGYAIAVDRVTRDGDRLVVRASFTEPPPGGIVTQVLTSPVDVVSIASADASGVARIVLLDGTGTERARADVP